MRLYFIGQGTSGRGVPRKSAQRYPSILGFPWLIHNLLPWNQDPIHFVLECDFVFKILLPGYVTCVLYLDMQWRGFYNFGPLAAIDELSCFSETVFCQTRSVITINNFIFAIEE